MISNFIFKLRGFRKRHFGMGHLGSVTPYVSICISITEILTYTYISMPSKATHFQTTTLEQ